MYELIEIVNSQSDFIGIERERNRVKIFIRVENMRCIGSEAEKYCVK